ncbi:DVU3141 family protein [Desulfovibrio sp. SGI.169]|uniref:DVU3141 family protein n=1 Tax=Desulfovibrio sp. SGI.169 TaxID=3420561 RepID=UPI003D019CCF
MNRQFPGVPPSWTLPPLILGIFLPLAGCGLFSDAPPPPAYQPGPLEAYLVSAGKGDSATLDDPEFGKNIRVTLDDSFTSARGESCKRGIVLAGQKEAEVVVVCRNAEGQWRLAPRVWGHGIDAH